jgi:hypothetical protein
MGGYVRAAIKKRGCCLGFVGLLLFLVGCGVAPATATPTFPSYTVPVVVNALTLNGLAVGNLRPAAPWQQGDPWPNVAVDRQEFDIPGIAPPGGIIATFATQQDVDAMAAYYAHAPDPAPYVYVHGNAILWLNNGLAKADAERYREALEALPP